jgi:hypothetical protein
VRTRFWAEAVLACLTAALTLLTLVDPEWIESVFGVEPDGGNGALEWAIVAGLALVTLALGLSARTEWRRSMAQGT